MTTSVVVRRSEVGSRLQRPPRVAVAAYVVAGVLLAAYVATLFVRRDGQMWPVLDNWCVDAFELVVASLALARSLVHRPGRAFALVLGLGLLTWAIGDTLWTIEGSPPGPSTADVFYLLFYPLAYAAVVVLIRSEFRAASATVWVDGVIAGLGAAAVCAAFGLDTVIGSASGSPIDVVVNLAYPIGDLILLALVVGALAVVPGWPVRMLLVAAGCFVLAIGDTVYLLQSSTGSYQVGTPLDATWVIALLLLSACVWTPPGRPAPAGGPAAAGFLLPTAATAAAVTVLIVGNRVHVSGIALGLAVATLAVAGARRLLTHQEVQALAASKEHQAVTDDLTGLGNRRRFTNELAAAFVSLADSGGPDATLALLMIDLNHFKEINDSFGHPTGDSLLRQIGARISSVTRDDDLVARLGGDEFAVLLTGADVDFATEIARRITGAFEPLFGVERSSLKVGASIGIALAPAHATSADELVRCADVAMYRAKAARCAYDLYESAIDDGPTRLRLMQDLRVAIAEGGLTLCYQPQLDLRTGEITSLEALARWLHPELGMIPPDQFIPLAEDCGLMAPLTAFVLEHAIAQCAEWRRQGRSVTVAANLSTTNLLDTALPAQTAALLDRYDLPPEALVVEITETTVMADLVRSKEVIQNLHDIGVVVSIDDFGTGFSSLAYLSELAVSELKIDRIFTGRLTVDGVEGRDEAIVRSSIELAHTLGMRVVAEGVERSDHLTYLADGDCDIAQGYVISFPQPPEDVDFDAIYGRVAPMMSERSAVPTVRS